MASASSFHAIPSDYCPCLTPPTLIVVEQEVLPVGVEVGVNPGMELP